MSEEVTTNSSAWQLFEHQLKNSKGQQEKNPSIPEQVRSMTDARKIPFAVLSPLFEELPSYFEIRLFFSSNTFAGNLNSISAIGSQHFTQLTLCVALRQVLFRGHSIHCYVIHTDTWRMAQRKRPSNSTESRVFNMLLLSTGPEAPLGIVDTTMLKALLAMIPDDLTARFLATVAVTPPSFDNPRFAQWVKACRTKYGDTQKEFAARVNEQGLALCDSDVGNLENNLRKDNYGVTRRREIIEAIQTLYHQLGTKV